jgi:hypothetical protein
LLSLLWQCLIHCSRSVFYPGRRTLASQGAQLPIQFGFPTSDALSAVRPLPGFERGVGGDVGGSEGGQRSKKDVPGYALHQFDVKEQVEGAYYRLNIVNKTIDTHNRVMATPHVTTVWLLHGYVWLLRHATFRPCYTHVDNDLAACMGWRVVCGLHVCWRAHHITSQAAQQQGLSPQITDVSPLDDLLGPPAAKKDAKTDQHVRLRVGLGVARACTSDSVSVLKSLRSPLCHPPAVRLNLVVHKCGYVPSSHT